VGGVWGEGCHGGWALLPNCKLTLCGSSNACLLRLPVAALPQLDTGAIQMWRASALLLRAIWDATPEMRHLYDDFIERIDDLRKKRSG
jgi:hypothetical protein